MTDYVQSSILRLTKATDLEELETIQQLWSGYGTIKRYRLLGSERRSVVVKHVEVPIDIKHPRGWDGHRSHQRKLGSYDVELEWYQKWSHSLSDKCSVPHCLGAESDAKDNYFLFVLEDLDQAGFPERKNQVTLAESKSCLSWLAHFHAHFLGESPGKLWETGTYWHLETRPDELEALEDSRLKSAAHKLDDALRNCPYQTFVHGDAKLANFCFSPDGKNVAAVDFQYVGGGCGMKDVAYFIGSCFDATDCDRYEEELLQFYFETLVDALRSQKKDVNIGSLVDSWRDLYPVAWADFNRFIKGWSPGHWKIDAYSERMTCNALEKLQLSRKP